jgi:hypothetical protein
MNGTRGDLASAVARSRATPHRSEPPDETITDYTSAASRDGFLSFGQAVAAHAAEVIATPVALRTVPTPAVDAADVAQLRKRLDDQAARIETLEAGIRLVLRKLGVSAINLEDIS